MEVESPADDMEMGRAELLKSCHGDNHSFVQYIPSPDHGYMYSVVSCVIRATEEKRQNKRVAGREVAPPSSKEE